MDRSPIDLAYARLLATGGMDVPVRLHVGFVSEEIGTIPAGEDVLWSLAGLLEAVAAQMRDESTVED